MSNLSINPTSEEQSPFTLYDGGPEMSAYDIDSLSVATSILHSGMFNTRRLECFSYGFWNIVLMALVKEVSPTAQVFPQFHIDVFTIKHDASINIMSSIASLPQDNTETLIPDFVILIGSGVTRDTKLPIPRPGVPRFHPWDKIKMTELQVGLVAEIKRPTTRSAKTLKAFRESMTTLLKTAAEDAVLQARAVFRAFKEDRVILLICSGELWRWRLAMRHHRDFRVDHQPRREIIQEVSESESEPLPTSLLELPTSSDMVLPTSINLGDTGMLGGKRNVWGRVEGFFDESQLLYGKRGENAVPVKTVKEKFDSQHPGRGKPIGRAAEEPANAAPVKKKNGNSQHAGKIKKIKPRVQAAEFKRYALSELSTADHVQAVLPQKEDGSSLDYNLSSFVDTWSGYIEFGLQQSRQNMSIIHNLLKGMTNGSLAALHDGNSSGGSENHADSDTEEFTKLDDEYNLVGEEDISDGSDSEWMPGSE